MARFTPPPSVATQQRELGRMIAAERRARGLTQQDLGNAIGYSQPNVSKIERAALQIRPAELKKIIATLGIASEDAEKMRALNEAAEARRVRAEFRLAATPGWFRDILTAEGEAKAIYSWTGERISGLLQCESYMLDQFLASGRADVDDAVHERQIRTKLFEQHPDRDYHFIISESAVDRLRRARKIGGAAVALEQLRHMIDLAERHPSVTIQIVPFDDGPLYAELDFHVLQFNDGDQDFAYNESINGITTHDKKEVPHHLDAWQSMRNSALTPKESIALLRQAAASCARPPHST
ncbi:helix-turn-helix domain-containing protein [Amycolatopsis thailandensis]|uniref:helix-turn-helix domain-containing protein n=1 Tax=Amycolatopsis thailandensis TaxID=589330 RepID=UPI003653B186